MANLWLGLTLPGPGDELYTLIDFLGHGSFGEVYLAEGATSNRVLAIKLLPVGQLSDESRVALLNEARLAPRVNHPNVVGVVHVGDGGAAGPYLMMEYVAGGTLAAYLDAQRAGNSLIPLALARDLMIQIAQGARAINAVLVHRDLKPDNILRDGDRLRITDFGIAKAIEESTRTHSFKGGQAVRYMAPEGWLGAANTTRLDVYSAGLVFAEILTLQHPLAAVVSDPGDWRRWQEAHLYKVPTSALEVRPEVGRRIADLVQGMAAKRSQDRPSWDVVLETLSSEDVPTERAPGTSVEPIVEAATQRLREDERRELERQQQAAAKRQGDELYAFSGERLLERLDAIVAQVNAELVGSAIKVDKSPVAGDARPRRVYRLPTKEAVVVSLFARLDPPREHLGLGRQLLLGGGWIGLEEPGRRSANVFLLRESSDDLYGRWRALRLKVAFGDERKIERRFQVPVDGTPFGISDAMVFYEEVHGLNAGGMLPFGYEVLDDVEEEFRQILAAAFRL